MRHQVEGRRLTWLALVAAGVAVWVAPMPADDTKEPPNSRHLVNSRARNIPIDFSVEEGKEKRVLWKAKLGKVSYGSPAIAGGKVFVGTNNENPRDPNILGDRGVIMCFEARTGRFLWQATHPKVKDDAQNFPKQGIASTPFVDGDRLYYVSNRGELVCADVNGDPKNPGMARFLWIYDMRRELKVFPCQLPISSPLVVGDLVFVGTGNGMDISQNPWKLPSPQAPSLIAVNKMTGRLVWQDSSPGINIMEGSWASPAYAHPKKGKPQIIYPGGDGWLYSFEPATGNLIWKFNGNPRDAVYNSANKRISDKCYFMATPVIYEDRCYIGVGTNPDDGPGVGHLWCIDLTKTGDVTPPDESYDPKSPKNRDSALVWHYGGKINQPPAKGRDIFFGRTMSMPAIKDGLLYTAELDGYFHCFDARTGKRYYEVDLRTGIWSSPYWVDGKVFLGNFDGELLVFAHGPRPRRLATIEVGPPIKALVKVIDGVLYFMTDSELYAIDCK